MSVTMEEIAMLPGAVPTNSPIREQVIEEIETALPKAVPTNSPIQEQVIEGIETAVNNVHSPLDTNVQEASQSGYTQNIRRPRAATTMDPIEEEAIEEASTTEMNGILNGLANCNEEAAWQEERHNQNNQRAAMTASLIGHHDYSEGPMKPMMGDTLSRSKSLIANAAQHEHNQDVPACTDDHHNKNCGRGMDTALMEYYYLRSKGVIPERPYEHWGCDTPEEEDRIQRMAKLQVRVAFRPVQWDTGYTGRGLTKRAMKQPDDIGPMNEIEPSNASPLQMQMHRRRQTPEVLHNCNEEGHQTRRPDFLDGDGVSPFGESLDSQNLGPCNEATPPHGVTLEITYNQRNKRRQEPTEDLAHEESQLDARVPPCKRLRTSGSNPDEVRGPVENWLRQQPHNNRPSERIRNLLNRMTTIDTGTLEQQQAITYDGKVVKKELKIDDGAEDINVRPTYAEQDPEEGNEAEEIIVMKIKSFGLVPLVKHSPKFWTDEELELLRLWVQDYGVTSWANIAWCLKHSEHECKTMYRYHIMALNRRAGRELCAGLPEDLLSIPPPPAPGSLLPLTSPTITARSLRPRTRQAAPNFQCGDIVYDAQARSLPKLAPNGTVVDNNGDVILSWPEEVALALKTSQPRRKAGQKLRLTVRPQTEDEQEDAQVSQPRRRMKLRLFVKPRE